MVNFIDLVGLGFSNEYKDYKLLCEKCKFNIRCLMFEKCFDEMVLERELRNIDVY